jgi:hypothetical protein
LREGGEGLGGGLPGRQAGNVPLRARVQAAEVKACGHHHRLPPPGFPVLHLQVPEGGEGVLVLFQVALPQPAEAFAEPVLQEEAAPLGRVEAVHLGLAHQVDGKADGEGGQGGIQALPELLAAEVQAVPL